MKKVQHSAKFDWLIKNYFSDPKRRLKLKDGEILMRKGHNNSRLYLVRSGKLKSFMEDEEGSWEDSLIIEPNNFAGVFSFFSKTFISIATVKAVTDCEVAYIDNSQQFIPSEDALCIEKQFMPVAVTELMKRQQSLQEVTKEKERALKKLMENEKLALLGQMAAGIAHELNNAVSVLARNSNWLVEQLNQRWQDPKEAVIFESGLLNGRILSSGEVRKRKKELQKNLGLSDQNAALLAQTGLSDKQLTKLSTKLQKEAPNMYEIWEIGATFNDMLIAAEQSTHVVKSIKTLGAQSRLRQPGLDINESINNAMALLRHKLKIITVNVELNPLPPITGNLGEFVQVWTNLIKNACESMCHLENYEHELTIKTKIINDQIQIIIQDNGPGIPKKILPNIFQPNVTTKISGLSFGLGVGLTIVQRIITEYNGTIDVKSSDKGAKFIIQIPVGGNYDQA